MTALMIGLRASIWPAALACAALAVPAQARDMNALRGHAVLRDFAKCSVKYEHDLAKRFALGRGPSGLTDEELRRAFDARCLGMWGVQFRATGLAIRAALAEELVRTDLGQWPELNPAGLRPLNWPIPTVVRAGPGVDRLSRSVAEAAFKAVARDALVGRLGECVVRSSPRGAVAVLNTKIDSQAELAALKALTPQIATCVKSGGTPNFTGSGLRYALALSYYRLANADPSARTPPIATASIPPVAAAETPDELAIKALHNFGQCIVRQAPKGAADQVLALDFESDEYRQRLSAMAKGHDRCLAPGWQLRSSQMLVAGAMAEAVLKSEVKAGELPQRLAYDPARAVIKARSPTETMALCTALQAPQATARLLLTEPASKDESDAVGTIAPVLTQCLKKDMKLTVNQPGLRALLALAAWRIVTTPKAPS